MGSVRDLYTTGDNDPEIEPTQYYRHYLYCDGCGSFELEPWSQDKPAQVERLRHGLAVVALLLTPVVVAALWAALGLPLTPAVLVALAAGMVIAPVLRGWVTPESGARRWRFVKWALLSLPLFWLADDLIGTFLTPWQTFGLALTAVVLLLVARAWVESGPEYLGLRCRKCSATYAYGTPFFVELDANPRQWTVADVPRPLGSSPFQRGSSVANESPRPPA